MAANDSTPRELSKDWLRRATRYDPETGALFWAQTVLRHKAGDPVAITAVKAYHRVSILERKFYVHRLAWLHMTGDWPVDSIDHINGDGRDNRWENLRAATHQANMENRRKAQKNNLAGLLGVSRNGAKYKARLQVGGETISVGPFDSPEAAHRAYVAIKREFHDACTI